MSIRYLKGPTKTQPAMRSLLSILCLVSFLVIPYHAWSQLKPKSKEETWQAKVPVSGEIRTGFISKFMTSEIKFDFFVDIPSSNYSNLSVELMSNDGRYNSVQHYDINGISGVQELEWETEHKEDLLGYKLDDISLLAWVNYDQNEDKNNFILAGWDGVLDRDNAVILINSKKKTLVNVVNTESGYYEDYPCIRIENKPSVSFNCYCEIPIGEIPDGSDISIVQRLRRSSKRYPFKIAIK